MKNELEKFTALAANSLALLQKEKAPFGVFVVDEFRRGHGCETRRAIGVRPFRVCLRESRRAANCRRLDEIRFLLREVNLSLVQYEMSPQMKYHSNANDP